MTHWICGCRSLYGVSVWVSVLATGCVCSCLKIRGVWADGWPDLTKETDLKEAKSVCKSLVDYQSILILLRISTRAEPHPCVTTLWSYLKWIDRMWGDLDFSVQWYNDGSCESPVSPMVNGSTLVTFCSFVTAIHMFAPKHISKVRWRDRTTNWKYRTPNILFIFFLSFIVLCRFLCMVKGPKRLEPTGGPLPHRKHCS